MRLTEDAGWQRATMTTDRPWGAAARRSPSDLFVEARSPAPMATGERRRVRHGFADVLAWCGEEVGPAPDELTHAFNTPQGLIVSQEVADNLKRMVAAR